MVQLGEVVQVLLQRLDAVPYREQLLLMPDQAVGMVFLVVKIRQRR
jgi:hypothetical protein